MREHSRDAMHEVLAMAVPVLHGHCRDPWTLIGSAAAWLAGADVLVADLDVLTSVHDAERLIDYWQTQLDTAYRPGGTERFRSRFARFRVSGMPVEVMGGLELFAADGWQRVQVDEIHTVTCAGVAVPIPSVPEQIRLLESFGRPKDKERAALLRAASLRKPINTATDLLR
ncbi:hypothetical protein [Dyella tabacisoli]|uniref:Nucleotidyltransferase family protein n=1 Tax=Dyella tabacisoli TaxID=2282381 RepID=A0A369UL07_9GAMM|nr:hypothetical protein [Dyella tabacisoli]RDD81452.1 hypothetical protein DVJ77_12145 [Dyella tabacisoli]